jgi:hypothetical protein
MYKLKTFFIFTLIFFFLANPFLYAQIIKDDFRVNDDTLGGENSKPDVEILENGEELIVWLDYRNGVSNIYGQAYDGTGAPASTNFKVSTYSGNYYESNPSISSFGDSLFVVWEYGYGQWLSSDGSKEGSTIYLGSGNILYSPDVAVSDSGFFIVCHFDAGSGSEIFFQRFALNGDSIGPRIIINDDETTENQNFARIEMNNDGYSVVVWNDYRNGNGPPDIYGQLVDPSGNPTGGNFLINDDGGNLYKGDPSCAMDRAGNFVVVWEDRRDGDANIYGQIFDNTGNKIGSNFLINDDGAGYTQSDPSCAMDSAGNFVVVWEDRRDGDANIYGQIFNNEGNPLNSNFRIDQTSGSGDDLTPRISVNENNFVVTWSQYIDNYSRVYKRRLENDGTPVGDQVLVNDLEGTANQKYPIVDMNASGAIVVTWADYRSPQGVYFQRLDALGNTLGDNIRVGNGHDPDIAIAEDSSFVITYNYIDDIYYQRIHPSGDPIGSPFIISDTTGSPRIPEVAIDSDNNAVVAWRDYRSGNSDIYAQRIDASGDTVGGNFRVNDDPGTSRQDWPDIAISPSGIFLITWYDRRNGDSDIYGQIYQPDGTPYGSNLRIDSGGTLNQYYPSAGALPDGNFIVAWQDYRTPNAIYAQIIDSTGTLVDTNFKVSDHQGYEASVSVAPSGEFVITWLDYFSSQNDIYAQRYNSDYSPYLTNFKVNNEIEGVNPKEGWPNVATDGSNIIFVWEDAKWQKGFDIAAKIFDWSSGIEDVVGKGKGLRMLEISSPILTGKEWLTISTDSPAKVSFQIINVAGMVVSSNTLNYTTPGIKKVIFDVSKLPCGPYFLSLKTNQGRVIKKTIIIR